MACDVTDETNDQKQAVPLAEVTWETLAPVGIERPKDDRGEPAAMVAMLDNGYYSEAGAKALEEKGFDPYIAAGRLPHHGVPHEVPESPQTAKEHMAAKVRTPEGWAVYARRKVIVEPAFGQIKEGRGFRRFSLRGLKNIRGEWCMVGLGHKLLNIWRYGCAPMAA